jgi:hypothetical protein
VAAADWLTGGAAVVAAVGTIGREIAIRTGRRARLQRDIELLAVLPEGRARQTLLEHIERTVEAHVLEDSTKSRDAASIALGLVFLVLGAGLVTRALATETWWWLVLSWAGAAFFVLFGAVGLVLGLARTERGAAKASSSSSVGDTRPPEG